MPGKVTTFFVAVALTHAWAWAGVREGYCARCIASTPLTCGHAIEVPLMIYAVTVSECVVGGREGGERGEGYTL